MDISWIKCSVEKISGYFDFRKINSPSTKSSTQILGPVENQINQVVIHQGLSYSDIEKLLNSVLDQKLLQLQDEAKAVYDARIDEFKKDLFEKIKSLPSDEIEKLREPDTQITLIEAAKISGRKQEGDLKNLLANLVINRIKNDSSGKEELKNIVYNEAILTVNKLTVDQLKIITLCYLMRYTLLEPQDSTWESFRFNYLRKTISPFLNFKNTPTEFRHIEYTGCGSLSLAFNTWDLIETFRTTYTFLFLNLVEREQIDSLSLPDDIITDIFDLDETKTKYFIRVRNKEQLKEYLTEKQVDATISNRLLSIYESHIKNKDDVKAMITDHSEIGKKLMDIWDTSYLKSLSLTSVGIAIGACYFEQKTGAKVDINIWIN